MNRFQVILAASTASLFLFISLSNSLAAAELRLVSSSAGGWNFLLNERSLEKGPGSDLIDFLYSSEHADLLSVDADNSEESWTVLVKRQDNAAVNTYSLSVKVSAPGEGSGEALFPETFIPLGTKYQVLMRGKGDREHIALLYRIGDLSLVSLQGVRFSTDIIFSIITND